jgi:hypothetical protein
MATFLSEPLSIQSVNIQFDRGFPSRPRAFYERLECREWLTCLDWLYAETSDHIAELEPGEAAEDIERARNILELLENEIREAEQLHFRLSLPPACNR